MKRKCKKRKYKGFLFVSVFILKSQTPWLLLHISSFSHHCLKRTVTVHREGLSTSWALPGEPHYLWMAGDTINFTTSSLTFSVFLSGPWPQTSGVIKQMWHRCSLSNTPCSSRQTLLLRWNVIYFILLIFLFLYNGVNVIPLFYNVQCLYMCVYMHAWVLLDCIYHCPANSTYLTSHIFRISHICEKNKASILKSPFLS